MVRASAAQRTDRFGGASIQNGIIGGAVGFHTAVAPRSPTRTTQTSATTATISNTIGRTTRIIAGWVDPPVVVPAVLRETRKTLSRVTIEKTIMMYSNWLPSW